MAKKLVIVESPAKAKTINKFLGKDFKIVASYGHIRDLPAKTLGVNIEEDFKPTYSIMPDKKELVKKLKAEAQNYETIYLATDPDREGEAISWHLAHILKLNSSENCRITFNEITKSAVGSAIENPRPIDMNMVNSQQTRRILDRIVGYKISPLLWKKVRRGLSAGRVQSVAARLICEREREIEGFVPEEYWNLALVLSKKGEKKKFNARYQGVEGSEAKRTELKDKDTVDKIINEITGQPITVKSIVRKQKKRYPIPPFKTSTLQQDASNKLGFTTKKTMSVAQQLYEGIEISGSGSVGLITYMRTDSTRIAIEVQHSARDLIINKFGEKYAPKAFNVYTSKGKAQDAHEAIRPTDLALLPNEIKESLTNDQYKLYKLIFDRFIASQMAPAVSDVTTIDFKCDGHIFRSVGSIVIFNGFLAIYDISNGDEEEESDEAYIPKLEKNEEVDLRDITKEQKFTQPPRRYTEASLVKALEERGIGRPSTYSPTISTIIAREYINREKKTLFPTELGIIVNDVMEKGFNHIVDYNFTADLENKLDDIENGSSDMLSVLSGFYNEFSGILDDAYKNLEKIEMPVEETDVICDLCGRNMVIKEGRFGKFLACPGFPECRNTKQIVDDTGHTCPKCKGRVIVKTTRKKKKFIGCENYPTCDFSSWNMPMEGNCPKCGTFLTAGKIDFKPYKICANPDCDYTEALKKEE
ncbi:MAG: type I DNA topoisomerase [Clostridia bacterium]|nr:type I DNA topoisomerase [Clostridia bacterium]MBN2882736.1 type I DNA topoisomerase [Clostridia bacterium]